jgi:hypothetical protein
MFTKTRMIVLGAVFAVLVGLASYPAFATVTVTPMLALIEGRNRYADVNLINVSQKPESYAMSWKFMKMVEGSGAYDNVAASLTDFDLSKHIVMTPRRVTIEGGGMQKIRLGLRLNGEPPAPGDYRAHLELMQDSKPEMKTDQAFEKGQSIVGVHVNVGFSIPVIYRVGESDAVPSIGDITTRINPDTKSIEAVVPMARTGGPFGVYGHLKVFYNDKMIGEIKNANIFSEINNRTFMVPLTENLAGGTLKIVYKHFDPKDNTIFAEKSVPVGR